MIKHIMKLIWNKKANNALLILEILLSFLVLFAVLSYVIFNLGEWQKPLGFDTENKWLIQLNEMRHQDSTEFAQEHINLKQALLQMDKVKDVAFSNSMTTFSGSQSTTSNDNNGFFMISKHVRADHKLADVLNIPMVAGRWFDEADQHATYKPIIVSKNFMDEYYPNRSMIDSVISFNGDHKIIGVMEDFRYRGEFNDEYHTSFFYIPTTDRRSSAIYLSMTPDATLAYEEQVRDLVASITKRKDFSIYNLEKLRRDKAKETWIPMMILIGICAFLCLNVALGLFGVLWYNINKRRSEVGLRIALGAHRTDISKHFVLEIFMLTGVAVALGTFFAIQVPLLKVTELPASNYYLALGASYVIIFLLVLICAYFPSREAARIAPAIALHED